MGIRQAERAVALLRIVTGLWILRLAFSHLVWTPWPWASPVWIQRTVIILHQHALDHPSQWIRSMIQEFLLVNSELVIGLTVIGELLVGISLTFGLMTVLGAFFGLLLFWYQGMLSRYLGDAQLGYHLFLGFLCFVFLVSRAGRRWGFDTALTGIRSRSLLW